MCSARLLTTLAVIALWLGGNAAGAQEDRVPGAQWTKLDSPATQGWSAETLDKAREFSKSIGTTALMIVQNGVVVAEWGNVAVKSPAHSVRKSLLSALIGIAVDEGKIDLSSTLEELGIDDNEPSLTEIEKQATVGDLIKARSGIYHAALYETRRMTASKPERGSHAPGAFWHYNNWDFNALGTIYRRQTGEDIFEAFDSRIAKPLQMQDYVPSDGEYVTGWQSEHEAYPFRISARDLARFGLLYLRKGQWNGRQIVPENWIAESTKTHSKGKRDRGYGYMWWTGDSGFRSVGIKGPVFYAAGYRRQYAFVFPERDLVIVHRINSDTTKTIPHRRQVAHLMWLIFRASGDTSLAPSQAIEDANGERLSGSAISGLFPGISVSGKNSRTGNPYKIRFSNDGSLSAVAGENGDSKDDGRWWVDEDLYCQAYDNWLRGREYCFQIVHDGNLLKLFDRKGVLTNTVSIDKD